MKIKKAVLSSILSQGMLPLFFYEDAVVSLEIVRTLYTAGIRAIEYTNRGKEALDNFKAIKKVVNREMPELYFGIGTVKNVSDAEAFIDIGADFIVAPIVNPEVGKVAHKHKLLWIPGCMTPTEIYLAQKNGADLIKIFPANVVGPGFISSIRELFPGQLFMPTGGVELEAKNISGWFHAGACAVGMGSKLISKKIMDKRQYDQLHADTLKAVELVKAAM
ncbi:bifunctional 4-hydroxy-2-oxoglutarate aldolase/2-dehydro-3-deoxy-phosphogluconate aldolase [Mucilaginibacter sp. L3T2-6]|uniref:bifunctional 4-hydroxy-2-oxoglutarate aldolase/2-dehydro-3-deoxy-phosphogluconate aldolase n=1 Tax=Mucilaginibacter sp. L3T2-6 TaxID=3062491 RepID=UPI00267728BA|nr:bifunctional 4-hydroxy-2-oxoglutarate aldolase/2-dehydro-3-deoxy-phosphogluconate aldolase [Mucilaginibacter sp. L3T2-6]MDO3640879.1 bifunctional 4-hydroxy-2-oxoglutarate aldolase/2-dehydro-3-deoxy-phosphogluconate aldolase [Mucilaginibacter sp. L3T2-6]MDV6213645.1 bifunctional 4-hydroxy-2-oxoglutarate aldolase/2-dehydro-3-deoxy-phosphogluconate aldolase [Mucilaginibacter sp. L3T2-6]